MSDVINIVDGSGDEVLNQLNDAFKAVATDFTGGTAPATTYAGQRWLDTSAENPILKQRNNNNTDWVIVGTFIEDEFQPANAVLQSDETITKQGNMFNGPGNLLMIDNQGRIPMLNGSLLTNLTLPTKQAVTNYLAVGSNHSTVKILAGTSIEVETSIGTKLFSVSEDTELNFATLLDVGTPIPGKDYSLFLVLNNEGELEPKITMNASAPEGYSTQDVLKIGGFHTLCTTIPDNFCPNDFVRGYNAGEIVPVSLWDNLHRPKCSPNGMAYNKQLDMWGDMYNQGGKDGNPTSVYGASRIHSRQWTDHADDFAKVGKRLMLDHEFTSFAEGSPQRVAIMGAAQPNPDTTGGHQATNGLFMLSQYFMWEMCGLNWQWLLEVSASGGQGWSVHDSLGGAKGQIFGSSLALLAGGYWYDSPYCGSRSRLGHYGRASVTPGDGGRGACEPLNPKVIVA